MAPEKKKKKYELKFGRKMSKRFELIDKLGDGTFSNVFHCKRTENGEDVAIKTYVSVPSCDLFKQINSLSVKLVIY